MFTKSFVSTKCLWLNVVMKMIFLKPRVFFNYEWRQSCSSHLDYYVKLKFSRLDYKGSTFEIYHLGFIFYLFDMYMSFLKFGVFSFKAYSTIKHFKQVKK